MLPKLQRKACFGQHSLRLHVVPAKKVLDEFGGERPRLIRSAHMREHFVDCFPWLREKHFTVHAVLCWTTASPVEKEVESPYTCAKYFFIQYAALNYTINQCQMTANDSFLLAL